MNMKRIAIEGGEGAGKSTLIKQMKNSNLFDQFKFVQEPGTTQKALEIREWIFDHPEASETDIATAYANARASLNQEVVIDSLKTQNVIFDRSIVSGIVYQTQSGELTTEDILNINKNADKDFTLPDIIVFIKIDPAYAMKRIAKNNRSTNYMDFMPLEKMEKIQNDFISFIKNSNKPYLIYDAKNIENNSIDLEKIAYDIKGML